MPDIVVCDACGRTIPPHCHYVVKIEVYADPQMPEVSGQELAAGDFKAQMAELIGQMHNLSAQELQNQVHRLFEFRLCRPCQERFLVNPLGKPRVQGPNNN